MAIELGSSASYVLFLLGRTSSSITVQAVLPGSDLGFTGGINVRLELDGSVVSQSPDGTATAPLTVTFSGLEPDTTYRVVLHRFVFGGTRDIIEADVTTFGGAPAVHLRGQHRVHVCGASDGARSCPLPPG